MEGFHLYRTIGAFIEAGFILLMSWEQWPGQYNIGTAPFSPPRAESSYFSFPSRVTRLNLQVNWVVVYWLYDLRNSEAIMKTKLCIMAEAHYKITLNITVAILVFNRKIGTIKSISS